MICRIMMHSYVREHSLCFFSQAECSITGSSHFTTFDGRHFTFLGICQYILVKGTGKNKFTITLQKAPCGQVRYIFFEMLKQSGPSIFQAIFYKFYLNYLVMLHRKYRVFLLLFVLLHVILPFVKAIATLKGSSLKSYSFMHIKVV